MLLWCGDGRIWRITPPAGGVSPQGWSIEKQLVPIGTTPNGDQGTGILGKWKYATNLDAFIGLQDSVQGNVWLYKPLGWQRPSGTQNQPPLVALTAPANDQSFAAGETIWLSAGADDPDGSIARVEFYQNAVKIGEDLDGTPFEFAWTTAPSGTLSLTAVAIDDRGGRAVSAAVTVTVAPGNSGTVVLQDGSSGYNLTSDVYLSSYHPSANIGSSTLLQDQYARYSNLLRFAIFQSEGGPVPNNAVIHSARLSLYKYSGYNMRYELRPLLAEWLEMSSTWSQRLPGVAWGAPGARLAGFDHSDTADAIADVGFDPGWLEFDVTQPLTRYSTSLSQNNGWILLGINGYLSGLKRFYSRESVTQTLRPKLEVSYTAR